MVKYISSCILGRNCFKFGLRQYQNYRIRSDKQIFVSTLVQRISCVKVENLSTLEISTSVQDIFSTSVDIKSLSIRCNSMTLKLPQTKFEAIKHSENKIITCFENEVGPGVLQSSMQQTYTLQENLTHKGPNRHVISGKCFES